MSTITLRPGPPPDDRCRSCIHGAIQPSLLPGFATEERCIHPRTEIAPEEPGDRVTYPTLAHARSPSWPCGPNATLFEERRRG